MRNGKEDIVVPETACDRGQIVRGELQSADIKISNLLAQFSKIDPQTKRAKIFIYPTIEQAKSMWVTPSPFKFVGRFVPRAGWEEEWCADQIWMKSITQITHSDALYYTQTSGDIGTLSIRTIAAPEEAPKPESNSGWFVANRCFFFKVLATPNESRERDLKLLGIQKKTYSFALSDSAKAEITQRMVYSRSGREKSTQKRVFAVCVTQSENGTDIKRDIDALLVLCSFGSRERTDTWHWSISGSDGLNHSNWLFGFRKFTRRHEGEDPLVLRRADNAAQFLSLALPRHLASKHREFLEAAVYAQLERDLPLEVSIVRLVSGIQSALRYGLALPNRGKGVKIAQLLSKFESRFSIDLSDLWPLCDRKVGPSLLQIRNSAVHGEVFVQEDWTALSFAVQNLRWTLERILLASLGWDIENSAVSERALRWYTAHQWRHMQSSLKRR